METAKESETAILDLIANDIAVSVAQSFTNVARAQKSFTLEQILLHAFLLLWMFGSIVNRVLLGCFLADSVFYEMIAGGNPVAPATIEYSFDEVLHDRKN